MQRRKARIVLVGAVALIAIIAAASKGTATKTTPAHKAPTSRRRSASVKRHYSQPAFAGIGSTRAIFVARNTQEPANPSAVPGIAWYTVLKTDRRSRVTAFMVTENFKPPMGNRGRLLLTAGILLPGPPARSVEETSTCIVWRDPNLKPLVGDEYVASTTLTGTSTAQAEAERSPEC